MRTARSSSRPGGGGLFQAPPPCGQTHTCKHITLPQTSFAGGKNTQIGNNATGLKRRRFRSNINALLI